MNTEPGGFFSKGLNRRGFVKAAGLGGLAVTGVSWLGAKLGVMAGMPAAAQLGLTQTVAHAQTITDTDILNFALNLEYLEAEFYTIASTGRTIEESGIAITGKGNPGATIGGKQVYFGETGPFDGDECSNQNSYDDDEYSRQLAAIVADITYDEQQHVLLLRAALGSDAIAKPAINLDALGVGFANFKEFLTLARAFEDTGVSAYGGAAPLIASKDILATAARIALTEALHSGNIRLLVSENKIAVKPLDQLDVLPPSTPPTTPPFSTPSGSMPPANATSYFTTDKQGLAVVRTPSQVLSIVYANNAAGTSKGGFFPAGVNGTITTV